MSLRKNKNALIGRKVESIIKDTISKQPSIIQILKKKFSINGVFENTSGSGIYGDKADVRISFTCGRYIDINVKGYGAMAFNQLVRTTIRAFCEQFELNESDKKELEGFIINKSKKGRGNFLFPIEKQIKWEQFFRKRAKEILRWGFSENPNREILAVYDIEKRIVRIYSMKEVLSKLCANLTMKFTAGGIDIANCISFQRKGGNGSLSKTISKTDIKHPGNHIALKLKILKAIKFLEDIKLAEYKI